MEEEKNYFLGIDMGTDSIGYAVTDTSSNYRLLKHNGEPMWGVTLFDKANLNDERRAFRTNRRRTDRRQQRVRLVQEIFAHEIGNVDPGFFRRIAESALLTEDKSDPNCIFNGADYTDAEYHREYPTIHHLICELVESDAPHDVRLVYLACAWLVSHRGHFLSEISVDNVNAMFDFSPVYHDFLDYCRDYSDEKSYAEPWSLSEEKEHEFGNILKQHGVQNRKQQFRDLLFGGKKIPKTVGEKDSRFPFSVEAILGLLAGGKVKMSDLYLNTEYEEFGQFSLESKEEDYQNMLANLGDDGELLRKLKALSDWAILSDLYQGQRYISFAKVKVYEQHKNDLVGLKKYVKANYDDETYKKIFRNVCDNNYTAYSGNIKDVKGETAKYKKCNSTADFCAFIHKTLALDKKDNAAKMPPEMLEQIKNCTFMPKQVTGDNRVLPYQLYYVELQKILEKAKTYLPFLSEIDEDGYRTDEKLLSIMRFRVPYYVGPLNEHGKNSWIKRRAEGKIYPWNFDEKVDSDASETAFINGMTNTCTYLAGEDVLPKSSLLYQKFTVLNEINNLKLYGKPIDVNLKQRIYTELFASKKKVTRSSLVNFLIKNGVKKSDVETLSGIDVNIKSSLSSFISFKRLLESGSLYDDDVEKIILHRTYISDNNRFQRWLSQNYPLLSDEDSRYIKLLSMKDFGRLSEKLLTGIIGVDRENGEADTIIGFMWERNVNLSELLLSDRFSFAEQIKEANADYYADHSRTLSERLNEMYVSNAVKRPIIRTLEIVSDVVKATGKAPERIFVEMARGANDLEKNKRTKTRKDKIIEYYDKIQSEEVPQLRELLESYGDKADNKLQSDRLYLYFMQLGKCMYSGDEIKIESLFDDENKYDIDHIYPKSLVYDDSILNNKALVLSTINHDKGNVYPIKPEIQNKMHGFWKKLVDNGLITKEKYYRLTRVTPFTEEEEWGFANRQLVETRQSSKVITTLLAEKYPDTEIVFVKAGLVSEFRNEYELFKSRRINDLHHAKDAYLNIVCGQVYHSVVTKQWFLLNRGSKEYSISIKALFARTQVIRGKEVWNDKLSFDAVKKTVHKNHCHMTVYAFCRHGGLFDQQPKKKASNLIPRKADLPPEKYGGYQKPTATFFAMVMYKCQKDKDILILPVDLLVAERFISDEAFAKSYLTSVAEKLLDKKIDERTFPLGKRILKINTVFEADGFRMCIGGKSNNGKSVVMKPIMPLILSPEWEEYIKKLERFHEKTTKNAGLNYDPKYDVITPEKNLELYQLLEDKFSKKPYSLRPEFDPQKITNNEGKFAKLPLADIISLNGKNVVSGQVSTLLNVITFFSRSAEKDSLTGITGECRLGYKLSTWKKRYKTVYIVDSSASGIWERKSVNLLSLI